MMLDYLYLPMFGGCWGKTKYYCFVQILWNKTIKKNSVIIVSLKKQVKYFVMSSNVMLTVQYFNGMTKV